MKTKLQKLLDSRKKLVGDMRKLSDAAEADNGRLLTQEEETRFTQMESEYDNLTKQIEREERLAKREDEEERESDRYEREPAYGGGREERDDDDDSEESDDDDREEREERRERRSGRETERRNRSKWGSFGEFLLAVMHAEDPSTRRDPRLVKVRAATGMNETVPAEGGFLVEKEQIGGLMQRAFEVGQLARDVRRLPVGPGKNGISMLRLKDNSRATGSRYGGIRAYWLGEGQEKIKSRPEFDTLEMKLKKLAALCYATDELLEDAVGLEGLIRELFPQEMAFVIDEAIMYGTGVGQPLGIVNSGAVIIVPKEASQAADTVVFENIVNMLSVFYEGGGSNPVWLINRNVLPQLTRMSLTVGTGGVPVWMPANGAAGQRFSTLFGYPVRIIEHAATLGDVGDIWLVDLSQYLMIEKGGIKQDVSIHVRFIHDETCFRFVKRLDGQPIPTSPITPYKGAAGEKHSPFVTLAARA